MPIVEVAASFPHGYIDDIARDQLPVNAAYRMKDWIPSLGARLRGRGGWTYLTQALSAVHAGPTGLRGVAWAPFQDDEHLIAVGNDGSVYADHTLNGTSGGTYLGAFGGSTTQLSTPPLWHPDLSGMVLIGPKSASGGFLSPKKYTKVSGVYTLGTLGGTPPWASCGLSWGDYLLLANGFDGNILPSGATVRNRIWVSGAGLPESWATLTDFWDSEYIPDIVGLAMTHAGILVFGFNNTSLISGDTPPAGGNWSEEIVFHGVGCCDTRTIAGYNEFIVFANNRGVYMTDGVTLTDLTKAAGIKNRWKSLVGLFNYSTGWIAAGGIYRDYYIISVTDNTGALVTCQVFDIAHGDVFEFSNIKSLMFASTPLSEGTATLSGEERLFIASGLNTHVQGLHPAWTNPDNMQDADGTNVLPVLETPFYKNGGPGQKRFRSMRATYDTRGAASLSVDYCITPSGAYTNAGSLPTTVDETRARVDIRTAGKGIGLRLTQVGLSTHSTLSDLELDLTALEGMR